MMSRRSFIYVFSGILFAGATFTMLSGYADFAQTKVGGNNLIPGSVPENPIAPPAPACPAPNEAEINGQCIPNMFCCGFTAPPGGASTLGHSPCLSAQQIYTYQQGVGGQFQDTVTQFGFEICQTSTIPTNPVNSDNDIYYADQAQCISDCNEALRFHQCQGWPGYPVPGPGLSPGPGLTCQAIDDYTTQLQASCNNSCNGACVQRLTGNSWNCTENNGNLSGRPEGTWVCPGSRWETCPSPPGSLCDDHPASCNAIPAPQDDPWFIDLWNWFWDLF